MENKMEQHHQQAVEGVPIKFLVSEVPAYAPTTVIQQRTIELSRALWGTVIRIAIIRHIFQVSKVWISWTDTSSECTTCCYFQNLFYGAGLVPKRGYCVDNTQLNEIMTLRCLADTTETYGEETYINGNGNLGGGV